MSCNSSLYASGDARFNASINASSTRCIVGSAFSNSAIAPSISRLSYIAAPLFLSFQLVNASAKKITITGVCSLHHVFQPVHKAAIVAAIMSANVMRATSAVAAAVPVITVGFPSANAITYTPPSAAFLFKEMMEKYREET